MYPPGSSRGLCVRLILAYHARYISIPLTYIQDDRNILFKCLFPLRLSKNILITLYTLLWWYMTVLNITYTCVCSDPNIIVVKDRFYITFNLGYDGYYYISNRNIIIEDVPII